MHRLYQVLKDNRAYVVLGVAVLLSLILMALGPSEEIGLARGVATGLLKAGHWLFAWPMDIAGLRYENRVLREQNLRLSLELMKLREARLENRRLRSLLQFRAEAEGVGSYLAAKVIARDPDRIPNTILIDVGRSDGVEKRMPVVTADGLVGRVLEAQRWTSVVVLLLDQNCRVSAVVQREGRIQGIVHCENGTLYLKNVKMRTEIDVGDVVVSSGLGGIFPKGLLAGRVASVGQGDRGLFQEVVLTPGVNFLSLEEVFVLKRTPARGRSTEVP